MRNGQLKSILASAQTQAELTTGRHGSNGAATLEPAVDAPTPPAAPTPVREPKPKAAAKPTTAPHADLPAQATRVREALERPGETRFGLAMPAAESTEEMGVISFRAPRWLQTAVKIKAAQLGVSLQEFGVYAMTEVLAQLEAPGSRA